MVDLNTRSGFLVNLRIHEIHLRKSNAGALHLLFGEFGGFVSRIPYKTKNKYSENSINDFRGDWKLNPPNPPALFSSLFYRGGTGRIYLNSNPPQIHQNHQIRG